jgi:ElaB/YqjD/DUF883 family membrane-anchored ribosome-binding protein
MDTESQVIQEQMRLTRASLAEKLERLEDRVIGAVDETTTAVSQTVQTVSHTVEETVAGARHTVQTTVEAARETMHETVDALKSAFDVRHQVEEHPWLMLGTSAAGGGVGGAGGGGGARGGANSARGDRGLGETPAGCRGLCPHARQ